MTATDTLTAPYHNAPGFKTGGPSAAAAFAVKEDAKTLRGKCLELLKMRGDLTADEAATMLDKSVLAIRPRFTEMLKMGLIFDSGLRRKNSSGIRATVWTIDKQAKLFN